MKLMRNYDKHQYNELDSELLELDSADVQRNSRTMNLGLENKSYPVVIVEHGSEKQDNYKTILAGIPANFGLVISHNKSVKMRKLPNTLNFVVVTSNVLFQNLEGIHWEPENCKPNFNFVLPFPEKVLQRYRFINDNSLNHIILHKKNCAFWNVCLQKFRSFVKTISIYIYKLNV